MEVIVPGMTNYERARITSIVIPAWAGIQYTMHIVGTNAWTHCGRHSGISVHGIPV